MSVRVHITDNTGKVRQDLESKASIFLRLMAEGIVRTSQRRTPKKTGRLRADVLKQVLGLRGKIVWGKNYASRMEDIQFKNYTTPGTGPHYAESAVKAGVRATQSIAREAGLI